ncbi:hypothetical protein C7A07_27620, partial [Pseudomonas fragi]
VISEGLAGVADSYDLGASLIHAGKAHQFGRERSPDRSYVYTLMSDSAPKPRSPLTPKPPTVVPEDERLDKGVRPEVAEVLQG